MLQILLKLKIKISKHSNKKHYNGYNKLKYYFFLNSKVN